MTLTLSFTNPESNVIILAEKQMSMRLVLDNGDEYKLTEVHHGAYVSMELDANFWYIESKKPDIIDDVTGEVAIRGTILYQYNCLLIGRKYYYPQKIKSR